MIRTLSKFNTFLNKGALSKNVKKRYFKFSATVSSTIDNMDLPKSSLKLPIYMDYQATTPMDSRVLDAMIPYFTEKFGNPHSKTHSFGWESEKAVENARKQVASLINASPKEIVFTSGATESNNTILKGIAGFYGKTRKHIITCQTEHKCVLDTCRYLEQNDFSVTYLPVDKNGLISLRDLENAITQNTFLVSIMFVNNEIGTIQPIKEIAKLCKKNGVIMHTDAAQAVGKIPVDVADLNIDLMSISGHKIYGPKGIGAIYIRTKPRIRMLPLINGGGQERGFRSGTLPTPLCVGLGKACEIAQEELGANYLHISKLRKRFIDVIQTNISHIVINSNPEFCFPGCVNISFSAVEGESLLMALNNVALSSGSACTSASLEPSYVLRAIGADEDLAHSSIRFGIGSKTTEEEIDYVAEECIKQVQRLRNLSPLWEMIQEGIDLKTIDWNKH